MFFPPPSKGNQIKNSSSTSSLGSCFALLLSVNLARVDDTQSLVAPHVVTTFHMPLGLQVGSPCPWLSATLWPTPVRTPDAFKISYFLSESYLRSYLLIPMSSLSTQAPSLGHSLELSFLQWVLGVLRTSWCRDWSQQPHPRPFQVPNQCDHVLSVL